MNILRLVAVSLFTGSLLLATGCASTGHATKGMNVCPSYAVAVLHPTAGNQAEGVVKFYQESDGVRVVAEISGLAPNSKHGFHIHEFGDCSKADGTSAGGHYNPEGHDHALPHAHPRHAGDLGNVTAGEKGNALYQTTVHNVSICCGSNPILGRGVILHANADDGGQPTGNAGPRIACGAIGIGNPELAE